MTHLKKILMVTLPKKISTKFFTTSPLNPNEFSFNPNAKCTLFKNFDVFFQLNFIFFDVFSFFRIK